MHAHLPACHGVSLYAKFVGESLLRPAESGADGFEVGRGHFIGWRGMPSSSNSFSSNARACSTWRDLKLRREARSSATASRTAKTVDGGINYAPP